MLGFCLSCSFACYHGYWEFMSAVLHTVQKTARHHAPSSLAYRFLPALQPLSLRSEGDIDVPVRDGRSTLILSALASCDFCLFLWIWVVFCFLISL